MVSKSFDKRFSTRADKSVTTHLGTRNNSDIISENRQLTNEFHKQKRVR